MNIDKLSSSTVNDFMPNVLAEVEGERSLYDKLTPFLDSAKKWLESEYIGADDFLSEKHNDFALKILVAKAFADAIPALDLVVTPTGMGVINTDNMAPASKERVERLISSLCDYVKTNLALLVDICRTYEGWRASERGQYFCSTFLSSLSVLRQFPADTRPSYSWIHENAMIIERQLEMDFIGPTVMTHLRRAHNSGRVGDGIIDNLIAVITRILILKHQGRPICGSIWYYVRPVVYDISLDPELGRIWREEMKVVADKYMFVNDIKGSFFF